MINRLMVHGGNLFCQFLLLFDEFLMEGYLSRISLPTRAPAHVSILIISFCPFIANKHGCHFDIIIQGHIEGGFLGFQETPFDSKTFLK